MHRGSRRQGSSGLGLLLLAAQVMRFGIDRIPPVTLSCLAANVLIYLRLIDLPLINQPLSNVCVSALHVWHAQDLSRLFLSSFFHSSDWHLYYNMASFLWKGTSLENRIGSVPFAFMVAVFTVTTNIIYVAISLMFQDIFGDPTYLTDCAVGFSGVLFALKVVTTHYMSGTSYVLGIIPVPIKYAVWAELALIHVLVPNSSFTGHLAGIIVGLLYVYGPLHTLMDIFIPTHPRGYRPSWSQYNAGYTYGSGFSGYSNQAASGHANMPEPNTYGDNPAGYGMNQNVYNNNRYDPGRNYEYEQPNQYNAYTGGLSEEEQLEEAIRASQYNRGIRPEPSAPPPPTPPAGMGPRRLYPDLPRPTDDHMDEMRRRRLERFDAH